MLVLRLEVEGRGEALRIVAPRAHAGPPLVRRETLLAALVLAQDAAVWSVVGELFEGG